MKKRFLMSIQITMIVFAIVSLFLPYLIRLNIHSGNLNISKIEYGHKFSTALISISFMLITFYYKQEVRNNIITIFLSSLICLSVYLVRLMIHFQGFIDHDFDTKAGIGFVTLTICSILFCSFIFIELFYDHKKKKVGQK
jgi:hypothetical protein